MLVNGQGSHRGHRADTGDLTPHRARVPPLHLGDLPPWPEFEDVWIPVGESLELAGRLGYATDDAGQPISADCIVILPGLYGDNGVQRTKDLASALRRNGFHALALELRSCGQTERRYPLRTTAFGILETGDLLLVSEWVEALPRVERSGTRST